MNEPFFAALSAWLTQAGLAGTAETDIVPGFCERCVAAGLPLARAVVFIDTLHRVHEGRLFRWGYDPAQAPSVLEYGRTSPDGLAATGFDPKDVQAAARCRNSPFYQMLQTGDSLLRRRLSAATKDEFAWLSDLYAEGVPTTSPSSAASPRTVSSAKWTVFTRHGQRRRRVDSAMTRSPRLNAWCPTSRSPSNQ